MTDFYKQALISFAGVDFEMKVGRDESDDKSDNFDSFTECGRTAHASAVHALWTTPGGSRLGIGCRRKPSVPSSRSEAVSGGRVE
ncbi:hypothetical protein EVAR_99063_1 [Eumeta japonica]|uniref:Uncharacterized protein n=1 Tax=Eumeta variegata TaxID=151549 RepID=A0A4C1Y1G3_EUMVA|nr:hypothetical protein EVAR_99063_1 [Eumeta japonica]